MSLRIDLLASQDYAKDEIQHAVWEKTKHNYKQGKYSRDGYLNHMNEKFCQAEESGTKVFAPNFDTRKKTVEVEPYRIPCTSLMGDPRNLSYYLEEVNGRRKRHTRLTERVRMLHLLLCIDAEETVQL